MWVSAAAARQRILVKSALRHNLSAKSSRGVCGKARHRR